METTTKPTVKLLGRDGNAFAIIGSCVQAAKRAGWSAEDVTAFQHECFAASSYGALLRFVMEKFDVE